MPDNALHINIACLPTLTRIFFNLGRKCYGTTIGLESGCNAYNWEPTYDPSTIDIFPIPHLNWKTSAPRDHRVCFCGPKCRQPCLVCVQKNAQRFRTIRKLGLCKFNKSGGLIRYKAVIDSDEPESPTRHLLSMAHLYIARNGVHYV